MLLGKADMTINNYKIHTIKTQSEERGKFVYFALVSGALFFLGGEAGGTDPHSPQSPYYVASTASGGAGTLRITAHHLTAEHCTLGTSAAQ